MESVGKEFLMRSFGWLCLVVVVGLGCIAGDARADDDEGATEIQRAIEEIEAEIARIEATFKEMQARAALHRQLADVARRRVELEKKAGMQRRAYSTTELDPFGRRTEARKAMARALSARVPIALAMGEPTYVVAQGAAKKGKVGKKKNSLDARVARLEAENKKLHAMVNALLHRGAHATAMPAPPALRASPPRPPMLRAPIAARKVMTSNKKSFTTGGKSGGIDARLDRIEKLLMQLLRGKRASSGVMRAPVPPAPPRRINARLLPVRVGEKVFEVKEAPRAPKSAPLVLDFGQPVPVDGRTYKVVERTKKAPVVKLRTENFDIAKKAFAKDKAAVDGVNAQIRMLEALLKQAEERMRALEKSLGK